MLLNFVLKTAAAQMLAPIQGHYESIPLQPYQKRLEEKNHCHAHASMNRVGSTRVDARFIFSNKIFGLTH